MFERLVARFSARPVAGFAPPPVPLGEEIWGLDRHVAFPGGATLPIRSTVVRLDDGSLIVISAPPVLGDATLDALATLGDVRAIVAPNTFHYLFVPACREAYPEAEVFAAPGLGERIAFMSDATTLTDAGSSPWTGELDLTVLRGSARASEVLFCHARSRSLIVTDALFNLPRMERWLDGLTWRLSGIPTRLGPARTSRKLLLRDPESVGACVRRIEEWDVAQVVVAHGEIATDDAKARALAALTPFAS